MSHNLDTTPSCCNQRPRCRGRNALTRYLRLTFISGPKILLTSRISGKCAFIMAMMCLPSLMFCALFTIPALIFRSPFQQVFFYFSMELDKDPDRWLVLCLAGLCTLLSLAIPATLREAKTPIRY